ncbi:Galnt3 [Symbiodinium natans]|uniref:Galnt3 protein n=1 Tax=Symbiodinium natans TaxID=878477 RepID=A0A812PEB8_9DINO|nr:Galnt3 [Symbiodinium natans]
MQRHAQHLEHPDVADCQSSLRRSHGQLQCLDLPIKVDAGIWQPKPWILQEAEEQAKANTEEPQVPFTAPAVPPPRRLPQRPARDPPTPPEELGGDLAPAPVPVSPRGRRPKKVFAEEEPFEPKPGLIVEQKTKPAPPPEDPIKVGTFEDDEPDEAKLIPPEAKSILKNQLSKEAIEAAEEQEERDSLPTEVPGTTPPGPFWPPPSTAPPVQPIPPRPGDPNYNYGWVPPEERVPYSPPWPGGGPAVAVDRAEAVVEEVNDEANAVLKTAEVNETASQPCIGHADHVWRAVVRKSWHATGAVPKYTIRVGLIWLVPSVSLLLGCFHLIPLLLAALLTPLEVPKIRAKLFGNRAKKLLPCLRVPALLRLSVLWLLQVWFIILWRASSPEASDAAMGLGDNIASLATEQVLQRLSVVLPCAGEGQYALNTVRAVYESLPADVLHEIIVVDDGSDPPLAESFLTRDVVKRYRVTIIRHAQTVGLIGAKKDGGDAATGDIVVFFDCHVAPQPGWHESFLRLIGENYRRIVTPVITDLDVGTWQQRGGNQGQAKCYLTWDADFKWFTSDDPYVPILSGGLLGISKRWWNETGGYDVEMIGWGGENLDQSLRSWLCGGEIMMAQDSFVAHMWRSANDARTRAHYKVQAGAAARNRLRAAVAWFGDFSLKLSSFPGLQYERRNADGTPWYGNLDNILDVKTRLGCKSFAWFMHRFKHVYEDGGLIPEETFRIQRDGRCLTYEGGPGTSPDGKGTAAWC